MNSDFKPVVDAQVVKLRALIAAEHAKGKAVGYLSIPLSTLGGGYFNVNREVGERTRQRLEARLGAASAWVLNPGIAEANIPDVAGARAGGAEYMVMWTRVLEGAGGFGEDFDFIHFVGPSDFALDAHDEWNIAAKINARRRGDPKYGTGNQLPTWFDGRSVSSAEAEQSMSGGYAGSCKLP
ncbi:MAG: hypothetical protein ABI433_06745 [Burkholderiaceae bacterium]